MISSNNDDNAQQPTSDSSVWSRDDDNEDNAILLDIFTRCDKNKDGVLDTEELTAALTMLDVPKARQTSMKRQFVDYDDFYQLVQSLQEVRVDNPEVERLFKRLDSENKGYINLLDIRRLTKELGEDYNLEELEDMLQVAVTSQDDNSNSRNNRLTIQAFEQLLKRLGFI
ncbi:hypothetical protein BDF22DRAFT_680882 [Syncephalis plumigaleata]|nr:hypothetical protein BDF22DRAFT_680882 [Syncephalis plumigaleata]